VDSGLYSLFYELFDVLEMEGHFVSIMEWDATLLLVCEKNGSE